MIDPRQSVYVGHLGPAPLYVHWSALILVYMCWRWSGSSSNPTEVIGLLLLLLVSIVLHELGHGLTSRALARNESERSLSIVLWAMGGVCLSQSDNRPWKRLLIVLAGPAVSLLLAGIGYVAFDLLRQAQPEWMFGNYRGLSLPAHLIDLFWRLNIALLIFNMIPIYPLDGGQALHNLLKMTVRNHDLVRTVSFSLSVVLSAAYFVWDAQRRGGQPDFYLVAMFGLLLYNAYVSLFVYRS